MKVYIIVRPLIGSGIAVKVLGERVAWPRKRTFTRRIHRDMERISGQITAANGGSQEFLRKKEGTEVYIH